MTFSSSTNDLFIPADMAAALGANPALAGLIQSKLNTLVGRSSGYLESLPDHIRRRVEGLKGVQVQHHKIEAEFQREVLELEKKYASKYEPLYKRRAGIIQGKEEPTAEEVKAGEELAVVEAMKMENVLRAEQDGVIAAVKAESGETLAVDQVILEFE